MTVILKLVLGCFIPDAILRIAVCFEVFSYDGRGGKLVLYRAVNT